MAPKARPSRRCGRRSASARGATKQLNSSYRVAHRAAARSRSAVQFKIANAIYYDLADIGAAIEPTFLNESRDFFDAEVKGLDFRASVDGRHRQRLGQSANTNGKIPTILDSIEPQIVMLLMNAIYFKGDWRAAFKTSETSSQPFRALRGVDVSVPTMHRKGGFRSGTDLNNATVAELPYGGDAFVMTILLPDENVNINTFVSALTAGDAGSRRPRTCTMPTSTSTCRSSSSPGRTR